MPEQKEPIVGSEVKKTIFHILSEFQSICDDHQIKCYLCGGTLLGAVRHHGFIPWDDDIDVCVSRPDYERLRELNREENIFPPYLQLVCYEDDTLSYPFMKILDKRTVIARDYIDDDSSDCLWIDILPVDGLPADDKENAKLYKKADWARKLFMVGKAKAGTGKTKLKSIAKIVAVPLAKMLGPDRSARKIIAYAKQHSYEDSDYVGILTWGLYGPGERMRKAEFEQPAEVSFEGQTFLTMSCWKEYLTHLYGSDYMELPPESKRESHNMKVWRVKDPTSSPDGRPETNTPAD